MPILIDSGIRRGSDIVKALALGATACMIGRPWLWGLAAGGEAGVARVLAILRAEFERTLALVGETDVASSVPTSFVDGLAAGRLAAGCVPAVGRNRRKCKVEPNAISVIATKAT